MGSSVSPHSLSAQIIVSIYISTRKDISYHVLAGSSPSEGPTYDYRWDALQPLTTWSKETGQSPPRSSNALEIYKNLIKYVAACLIAVLIHQCVFGDKNVVHSLPAWGWQTFSPLTFFGTIWKVSSNFNHVQLIFISILVFLEIQSPQPQVLKLSWPFTDGTW